MESQQAILATYLLETPHSLERAIDALAGEGSTGTFVAVPGETAELKERFRTRLHSLQPLESSEKSAFPQPVPHTGTYQRAEITIAIPLEMTGDDLSTVLASVAGNIFELKEISSLRLMDVELPPVFAQSCPLPRYGVTGTRQMTGIQNRPLIGCVIKPPVGLTPPEISKLARVLAESGVDFIKDDELLIDPLHCPFEQRVEAVMRIIHDHAEKTGKQVLVAFNITGDVDDMMRRHDIVVQAGGNCIQINVNQVGFAAVSYVRRNGQLMIHGHSSGWGMYTRQAFYGIGFKAYNKLWRLTGVDHLTVGWGWETDESAREAMQAYLTPIFSDADRILPAHWGEISDPLAASDHLIIKTGTGVV